MAERHRGDQRVVGDLHAVEDLEPLAQAAQDRDGVLDRRLVHHDRLEPALKRRVLLDPLAVLVQRRRADHVQLAAGQHRLEHVAGVHRALGGAGAHDGVQLVHEQQDAPGRRLDLRQDGLEPLLELAPVLGPGHQRAHVEAEDRLVAQPFRDVAAGDPLGQALYDGGLAHAGVADQHRVVLGLPGQDLDDPPDLGVAADDRVEPAAGRLGHQVPAVLRQRLVGPLGRGRGDPLVAADLRQRLQEAVPGQALLLEQPPGRAGLPLGQQGQQQVLDRDVLVLEPVRLLLGRIQQAAQPLGDVHLPGARAGAGDPGPPAEFGLHRGVQPVRVRAGLAEQPGGDALGLVEQREEQVLGVHLGVTEAEGLGLGVVQCFGRLLGQVIGVHDDLPGDRDARRAVSRSAIRSSRSVTSPTAA